MNTAHSTEGERLAAAIGAERRGLSHTKQAISAFSGERPGCISLAPNAVAERRISRLKRSVWASGHLHAFADPGFRSPVCWFVTLTYRPGMDWRKDHITEALVKFRRWCKDKGVPCRYTWVAELQQRGAVHYHLLAWLPPGVQMRQWDRETTNRAEFWPHGMTNTQPAKSGVGYLMKYLSKLGEHHRFPKGLRLYGIGGLTSDARTVRRWYNLPGWAKLAYGVGRIARRAGGLCDLLTGEMLPPAFKLRKSPSALEIIPLREVPRRWGTDVLPVGVMPGAYSEWSPC